MPMEQFAQHLLPSLLSLSSDPVPNVRVLVAKALRQSVLEKRKTHSKHYKDKLEDACITGCYVCIHSFIRPSNGLH